MNIFDHDALFAQIGIGSGAARNQTEHKTTSRPQDEVLSKKHQSPDVGNQS